jgi:GntR family transcriptional repressor for pyruvate dehydrogenase complex
LTEAAIEQVRMLITSGSLVPGQRLPPEAELAESLGTSRSTVREAVRALVTARVLDVRRGDGTFVTSLRPELLLAGIGAAADLLQHGFTLELVQVRRILEPAATAMAATRITEATLDQLGACLHQMSIAPSHEELVQFDEEFHHLSSAASGSNAPRC